MTPNEQKKFEKNKHTLFGDESERLAFSNFSHLFADRKYNSTKIFSLNGIEFLFPNSDMSKEKTGEFDQVLVVDVAKIVIYIEYKRTFSAAHAKKKRQFEHFRQFFETNFPSGKGWKLVTSYGFTKWPEQGQSAVDLRPCADCRPYVFLINDSKDMRDGFDDLLSVHKRSGEKDK